MKTNFLIVLFFSYLTVHAQLTVDNDAPNDNPVYLVNDICLANNFFYIVDKQQGFVFKYDKNFKFISKSLHFGVGKGCLYDPISIFGLK